MLTKFQLQYDSARIPELAAKYMATPYKGGTAADADREMEEAGRRITNVGFTRSDVEMIYRWKSARRMDRFNMNTDNAN